MAGPECQAQTQRAEFSKAVKPGDLPARIVACDGIGRGVPVSKRAIAIQHRGGSPLAADAVFR